MENEICLSKQTPDSIISIMFSEYEKSSWEDEREYNWYTIKDIHQGEEVVDNIEEQNKEVDFFDGYNKEE